MKVRGRTRSIQGLPQTHRQLFQLKSIHLSLTQQKLSGSPENREIRAHFCRKTLALGRIPCLDLIRRSNKQQIAHQNRGQQLNIRRRPVKRFHRAPLCVQHRRPIFQRAPRYSRKHKPSRIFHLIGNTGCSKSLEGPIRWQHSFIHQIHNIILHAFEPQQFLRKGRHNLLKPETPHDVFRGFLRFRRHI